MNPGNSFVLGSYAIYILAVVFAGNGAVLLQYIRDDGSKFVPWLLAVLVLLALYSNDQTKRAVAPIGALLVLNVILRNFDTIEAQFKTLFGDLIK